MMMKPLHVIAGVLAILLLLMGGILVYILIAPSGEEGVSSGAQMSNSTFDVSESGLAGDHLYAVYDYQGDGNLTMLGYDSLPQKEVVIINDSQAIQATRFDDLVSDLMTLKNYGYKVTVSDEPKIGDAINIVPTGAIPSYALFDLQQNTSTGTIIYFGATDLMLSSGIKEMQWYGELSPDQRKRIVVYNSTLDDFLSAGNVSLSHEILYNTWELRGESDSSLAGSGTGTCALAANGSTYFRLVYLLNGNVGMFDSDELTQTNMSVDPVPASIYPWEKSDLRFELAKTNGTAFFTVKKDGKVVQHDELRRVTDENVFVQRLSFTDPGNYIVTVDDNSGTIASGLLHIKDVKINLTDQRGFTYVFSVTVDGKPLNSGQAVVWLGNSTDKQSYFIGNGELTVNTKLEKGMNIFNFDISGSQIQVPVDNTQVSLLDFYIAWGIPGFALVIAVYFGARLSRRPTYRLRFGDSANYVRQEVAVPTDRALDSFKAIRRDMKLDKVPITAQEFSVSLKRYLTNGADVTEGNVEELLKKLEKSGYLESYRDYYQLKGEGDVKRNALRRMIREDLIQSGVSFDERGGKFFTKDIEIGFFGDDFTKKGIIVVEDKAEGKRLLSALANRDQAKFRVMQANDVIRIVPVDRLSDFL